MTNFRSLLVRCTGRRPRVRPVGAVIAAGLALVSGCHSYQRTSPLGLTAAGNERVRVEFAVLRRITLFVPDQDTVGFLVRGIEGELEDVRGDTLEMRLAELRPTDGGRFERAPDGSRTTIVLAPDATLHVVRLSGAKSTVAVLGFGAVLSVVALLLALSDMPDS